MYEREKAKDKVSETKESGGGAERKRTWKSWSCARKRSAGLARQQPLQNRPRPPTGLSICQSKSVHGPGTTFAYVSLEAVNNVPSVDTWGLFQKAGFPQLAS